MLIVFEGIDGAGKTTQASLLAAQFHLSKLAPKEISFPNYKETFAGKIIANYLNGSMLNVRPHVIAAYYAMDRFETLPFLLEKESMDTPIIMDRYVASNAVYQASRMDNSFARDTFTEWIGKLEFETYGLPRPDLTIFLDMPVDQAMKFVQKKGKRDYTTLSQDIHERDAAYLQVCRDRYHQLAARQWQGTWRFIPCCYPNGEVVPIRLIHQAVWRVVLKQFFGE